MRTDLATIFHEVRRKQRDILAALRKARHFDGQHVQAEEQILTKAAGFDGFLKIAICGGNNADVHLDQSVSADAFELSVLKNTKQIGLHCDRKLADFIKKQRTAFHDRRVRFAREFR